MDSEHSVRTVTEEHATRLQKNTKTGPRKGICRPRHRTECTIGSVVRTRRKTNHEWNPVPVSFFPTFQKKIGRENSIKFFSPCFVANRWYCIRIDDDGGWSKDAFRNGYGSTVKTFAVFYGAIMFVRYLAIPFGFSLGFVPTSENLSGFFRRTNTMYAVLHVNPREDQEDNQSLIHYDSAATGATSRRKVLILTAALATTAAVTTRTEASTSFNNDDDHVRLLESSHLIRVQTRSAMSTNSKRPSVRKVTKEHLLEDLQSNRAIFLGEHHPDGRDHLLQAALIRSLYDSTNASGTALVVGLEAIQRKFQPFLDQYCAGVIDEEELQRVTEWESRWYWSFEAYKPIFQTCRELGIGMLALDIATEDRLLVEQGGLEALDPDILKEYIPDQERFSAFGSTLAYRAFINYTLKPPFELQQRTNKQRNKSSTITWTNFVARQMLRDEGMASAAFGWLSNNPSGILVGCTGINHVTFGCGVQGRLEQKLASISGEKKSDKRNQRLVASVLINPDPLNTGTELKICQGEGRPPVDDDEDDESTARNRIFVPNMSNQVCIENSIEVQNYALQVDYLSPSENLQEKRDAMKRATIAFQAKTGETVLRLSDYLIFSPTN